MRALYSSSNKMNNNRMWFVRHRRIWKHYLHAPEISKRRNATTRVQILYYTIDHIYFNIIIIIRHLRRQKKKYKSANEPIRKTAVLRCADHRCHHCYTICQGRKTAITMAFRFVVLLQHHHHHIRCRSRRCRRRPPTFEMMVKESVTLWWCMACLSSSHPNWPCRPRTQRAHVFQEYCPLFCGASCSPFAICQKHQPSHTTHTHMDAVCTRARLCMCLSFALMLHYTLLLFFLILPAINLRTLSFVIVALFFFFFFSLSYCLCLFTSFFHMFCISVMIPLFVGLGQKTGTRCHKCPKWTHNTHEHSIHHLLWQQHVKRLCHFDKQQQNFSCWDIGDTTDISFLIWVTLSLLSDRIAWCAQCKLCNTS